MRTFIWVYQPDDAEDAAYLPLLLLPPGAWHLPQPGSAQADDPTTWWQT